MADTTELDYIRTFISKVCTSNTVKHIVENGNDINNILGKQKILIKHGELLETFSNRYLKRFPILINEPSEVLLITTLNNLIDGIQKLQKRQTISGYTKPSTLVYIKFVTSNRGSINFKTKRWNIQVFLDVEFTTS